MQRIQHRQIGVCCCRGSRRNAGLRLGRTAAFDLLVRCRSGGPLGTQYHFVLALDAIQNVADLRDRASLERAIDKARIDLSSFFQVRKARAKAVKAEVVQLIRSVEADAGDPEYGEFGGCWLWITDTTHAVTRALLRAGEITITRVGKYILDLQEFSDQRSIRQRQDMTLELARRLKTRFGLSATYISVTGKDDPDAVPFYNESELDDDKFYNYSNNEEDY